MRAYYLEGNNIAWLNGVCLLLIAYPYRGCRITGHVCYP